MTQSFNSYSGPNAPSIRLSSDEAYKLTEYLKFGLAREPDFSAQHQGIFIDAYVDTKPQLQSYITDTESERLDWGWAEGSVIFSRSNTGEEVAVPAGTRLLSNTPDGSVYITHYLMAMLPLASTPLSIRLQRRFRL